MIPRKKIDIDWSDLAYGVIASFAKKKAPPLNLASNHSLTTLSVRSGFDLILQCLALPKGSEILVSAITIRDMVKIIEYHNLKAIPIDLDSETFSIKPETIEKAITPQTKAILVAHLFGSRISMESIADVAEKNNLYLFEDCAQAYMADGYWGHDRSDFILFSFGTIKTATALGGGLIFFKDKTILDKVNKLQQTYPAQTKITFLKRVVKYSVLKLLSYKIPYSLFTAAINLTGKSHDTIISQMVRGFAGESLIHQIRRKPSNGLLLLLERRLSLYCPERINNRKRIGMALAELLSGISTPGGKATNHSYWVFPITIENPEKLINYLWSFGIDATKGASSLYAVPSDKNSLYPAINAQTIMNNIVYLPIYDSINQHEIEKIANAVVQYISMQESCI